jgi:2-polyprenyl-6-methoxyphenol hydroxylase-like FAD-dependent oxidoreductase
MKSRGRLRAAPRSPSNNPRVHQDPILNARGGNGRHTAAIALRRAGFDAQVYERAPEIREVGAGITLQANAILALRTIGLDSAMIAAGRVATKASLQTAKGKILSRIDLQGVERAMGAPAVAIHRATLQDVLVSALGRENLHLDSQVVRYEARQDGVTVHFAAGRRLEGALLIGADGIRSAVRAQLLGDGEPLYAGYVAWRGVAEPERAPDEVSETWGCGRRFGVVPIEKGRVYWFATLNAPPGGRDEPGTVRHTLENLFQGWHPPIPDMLAATPEKAILRNDMLHRWPVERWGEGRITLLGDAAHPMTPNLGQGACQAIEDAVALAECLRQTPDPEAALRQYEARRRPRANGFVRASLRMGRVAQMENSIGCRLRNTLVSLVPAGLSRRQLLRTLR